MILITTQRHFQTLLVSFSSKGSYVPSPLKKIHLKHGIFCCFVFKKV